jgi:hypothetical protein
MWKASLLLFHYFPLYIVQELQNVIKINYKLPVQHYNNLVSISSVKQIMSRLNHATYVVKISLRLYDYQRCTVIIIIFVITTSKGNYFAMYYVLVVCPIQPLSNTILTLNWFVDLSLNADACQ